LKTGISTPLPASFCFDFFIRSLVVLLQSEHYQVLLKALTFIYTHTGRLYGDPRIKFLNDLLFANFYRLFLHWCPEVRKLFHYSLIYKLRRSFDPERDKLIDKREKDEKKEEEKKKQDKIKTDIKRAGDDGDDEGSGNEENGEEEFGPCSFAKTTLIPSELVIDNMFSEKLHKYMQNISDQTSKANARTTPLLHFPQHLAIYAPESFHEYHKHSTVFRKLQQTKNQEEAQKKKERDDLQREDLGMTVEQWQLRPPSPKTNPAMHGIWCPDLSFEINTNVGGE